MGYWLTNHGVAEHMRISTEFMKKLIANRKVTNVNAVCTPLCTWGRLSLVDGVSVGSIVPEVLAAFVASLATVFGSPRDPAGCLKGLTLKAWLGSSPDLQN